MDWTVLFNTKLHSDLVKLWLRSLHIWSLFGKAENFYSLKWATLNSPNLTSALPSLQGLIFRLVGGSPHRKPYYFPSSFLQSRFERHTTIPIELVEVLQLFWVGVSGARYQRFTSVLYILFLVFPNSLSNSRPWWRPEYEWLLHVFTFNFLITWFTYLRFTLSIFKLTKQFSQAAGLWTRPVSSRNNIESTVRLTWNQLCQSEEAYISPSFIVIPDKAYMNFTVIILYPLYQSDLSILDPEPIPEETHKKR